MEFDAKTAIIIGFFCKPEVFLLHMRIPLTVRNLQHVLSYLPTLLEFFIGETLLTGSEISLP